MTNLKYEFDEKEHLHLLGGKALTGTSSVGNVLAKNLVWWSAELSAVECLEVGEKIPTIREEYLAAVNSGDKKKAIDKLQKKYPLFKKARFAHYVKKNKAAVEGTDLHADLEEYVKQMVHNFDGKPTELKSYTSKEVETFAEWAIKNVKEFIASEAHCYDEELWVGGITDCVALLKTGKLAIIDFKSAKEAYVGHFIQCSGYAIQVDKNGLFSKDGEHSKKLENKIEVLIVVPFGAGIVKPEIKTNIEDYKAGFRHAVGLYRLMGL
jgi:ribosomal protein S20